MIKTELQTLPYVGEVAGILPRVESFGLNDQHLTVSGKLLGSSQHQPFSYDLPADIVALLQPFRDAVKNFLLQQTGFTEDITRRHAFVVEGVVTDIVTLAPGEEDQGSEEESPEPVAEGDLIDVEDLPYVQVGWRHVDGQFLPPIEAE